MEKVFEFEFRGRPLKIEIGKMAKQASSACLVRYGDTVVLSAVTNKKEPSTGDFFPLMVLYQEKQYSVGKIPGGFIKREGRPTENATLAAGGASFGVLGCGVDICYPLENQAIYDALSQISKHLSPKPLFPQDVASFPLEHSSYPLYTQSCQNGIPG